MDEVSGGRGHREKIPSAKLKELTGTTVVSIDKSKQDHRTFLPVYVPHRDPKFEQEQDEVKKIFDHTKISADGQRYDFYSLGPQ